MRGRHEESTSEVERRESPRADIELVIQYGRVEQFCQDYARNLSLGGIFIETPQPLEMGTRIPLSFALPGCAELIQTTGLVVRTITETDARDQGLRPGMAVRFDELSEDSKRIIDMLVLKSVGGS